MCTAVSVTAQDHYFGRNLDFHTGFGEEIVITPRNFPFSFSGKYAIIGTAKVEEGYPLYFDAANEKGLGMAGLYFPDYAVYLPPLGGETDVPSFQLIPWVLSQCETVSEAMERLCNIRITQEAFRDDLPPSPLHWLLADKTRSVVVEQTKDGICIQDNPVGVLTNNPPFSIQMLRLSDYRNLSCETVENRFLKRVSLPPYSRGMGAIGLPGDFSSVSRFVKACFVKENSIFGESELERVHQFFHILGAVEQPEGCVKVEDAFEKTYYSSCCNTTKGVYYYTTYQNRTIHAVDMHREDLNGTRVTTYPMKKLRAIRAQNRR